MQQRKILSDRIPDRICQWLCTAVMGILILRLAGGEQGSVYLCVLTLWLFLLPGILEEKLRIQIPELLESLILVFIFASEMLGELNACYVRFPWWDGVLHGTSGFLAAAMGIGLGEILSRNREGLPVPVSLLIGFCFSMTVGALWELLEWGVDCLFELDMQKDAVIERISSICLDPAGGNRACSIGNIRETVVILKDGSRRALGLGGYLDVGLRDTMEDLTANLAGAAVFCAGICRDRRGFLRSNLIPRRIGQEEQ